jgi:ribosome-associated protein
LLILAGPLREGRLCARLWTSRRRGFSARLQEDIVLSERVDAGGKPSQNDAAAKGLAAVGSKGLLSLVLSSLEDDKAEDVVEIDLRGKTEIADAMVIASGRSTRQVSAMAEKLIERLKQDAGVYAKVEGKDAGDWVLIDAGDVIVHIFRPEVRDFYQLEKMWMPAPEAKARVVGNA